MRNDMMSVSISGSRGARPVCNAANPEGIPTVDIVMPFMCESKVPGEVVLIGVSLNR